MIANENINAMFLNTNRGKNSTPNVNALELAPQKPCLQVMFIQVSYSQFPEYQFFNVKCKCPVIWKAYVKIHNYVL